MADSDRFGSAYYARFYEQRATRVADRAHYVRLARFIASYTALLGLRVQRILDAGAGVGWLHGALRREFPRARCHGIDLSEYAVACHGWELASVVDYAADKPFDLVVCSDVLQYLTATQATRALHNLAALCTGAMYFSVLTREDWADNCDRSRTDGDVHIRPARWYRTRLRGAFRNLGGGVYLRRDAPVVTYALEALD